MASAGFRSLTRSSLSAIQSCLSSSRSKAAARLSSSSRQPAATSAFPAPGRRFPPFSRFPAQLGCCSESLLPLHSAVAAARLTSCLSSTSRCFCAISQDGIDDT